MVRSFLKAHQQDPDEGIAYSSVEMGSMEFFFSLGK